MDSEKQSDAKTEANKSSTEKSTQMTQIKEMADPSEQNTVKTPNIQNSDKLKNNGSGDEIRSNPRRTSESSKTLKRTGRDRKDSDRERPHIPREKKSPCRDRRRGDSPGRRINRFSMRDHHHPSGRRRPSPRRWRSPSPRRHWPRRSLSRSRSRSRSRLRSQSPRSGGMNGDFPGGRKSFLEELAHTFAERGQSFPELEGIVTMQSAVTSPVNNMPSYGMANMAPPMISYPAMIYGTAMPSCPPVPQQMIFPPQLEQFGKVVPATATHVQSMNDSIYTEHKTWPTTVTTNNAAVKQLIAACKKRVTEALTVLGKQGKSAPQSGQFYYRHPTYVARMTKGSSSHKSPLLGSSNQPLFAFTSRNGISNDPFDNVSQYMKKIINSLQLDEGSISVAMRRQNHSATHNESAPCHAMAPAPPKKNAPAEPPKPPRLATLVKQTQTAPYVCERCYEESTKLYSFASIQTDPVPVERSSEFGSITELTPNQVKAVSALIKYLKQTQTSGSLTEIGESMRVNNLQQRTKPLRDAYHYFDAMLMQQQQQPIDNQFQSKVSNENIQGSEWRRQHDDRLWDDNDDDDDDDAAAPSVVQYPFNRRQFQQSTVVDHQSNNGNGAMHRTNTGNIARQQTYNDRW